MKYYQYASDSLKVAAVLAQAELSLSLLVR